MNHTSPDEQKQGVDDEADAKITAVPETSQQNPPCQQQDEERYESEAQTSFWDTERVEARRRSNRESAKRCRLRQKITIQELEAANAELRELLEAVIVENRQLRRMMEEEHRVAFERNRELRRIIGRQELSPAQQHGLRDWDLSLPNLIRPQPVSSVLQSDIGLAQFAGYPGVVQGEARRRVASLPAYYEASLPYPSSIRGGQEGMVPRHSTVRHSPAANRNAHIPPETEIQLIEEELERMRKRARR